MCDTLCIVGDTGTLFGKNSDRPPPRPRSSSRTRSRPARRHPAHAVPRAARHRRRARCSLSRPAWLWGAEHGVNEHRRRDRQREGLDRRRRQGRAAGAARHGPGAARPRTLAHGRRGARAAHHAPRGARPGRQRRGGPRRAVLLVVPDRGSGRRLDRRDRASGRGPRSRSGAGAAISNRISLATDWTRASADVAPGQSIPGLARPEGPDRDRGPAPRRDRRLRRPGLREPGHGRAARDGRDAAASRRPSPGARPGDDGDDGAPCEPVPTDVDGEWNGITVCMHLRDYQATTASMVAELPRDPDAPMRAWVALGSPCVSVYVPVFPPRASPAELAAPATWARFAALRDRVEADPDALAADPGRARDRRSRALGRGRRRVRDRISRPARTDRRDQLGPHRRRVGAPRRLTARP